MAKITVQGVGKVSGQPDIAVIQVVIQNKSKDQATARKENNVASEAVLAILKRVVEEKDLYAQPARVWPEYNYTNKRGQQIIGYQANNSITAKLRKLEMAQALVNEINNVDSEKVQIGNFQIAIDDRTKLENEARAKALADAKQKAQLYASESGFSVVVLKSLDESMGGGYNRPMRAMAMAAACDAGGPPDETLEMGNIDITVNVNACFKVGNPVELK
jgi:uncharacterized protein YggE